MATQGNFMYSEQDRDLARRSALDRKRLAASGDFSVGAAATTLAHSLRCHRRNQLRYAWAPRNPRAPHCTQVARQPHLDGVKPA